MRRRRDNNRPLALAHRLTDERTNRFHQKIVLLVKLNKMVAGFSSLVCGCCIRFHHCVSYKHTLLALFFNASSTQIRIASHLILPCPLFSCMGSLPRLFAPVQGVTCCFKRPLLLV